MKKFYLPLLLFCLTMAANTAFAKSNDPEENGFNYRIEGSAAIVTGTTLSDSEIHIPATLGGFPVTAIDICAFEESDCQEVSIPDTVTEIGGYAFYNCQKLQSVSLPQSLQTLKFYAFSGCTALTSVSLSPNMTLLDCSVFKNCSSLKSFVLPDSIQSIEESAFENCPALTDIQLSSGLRSIGSYAFYGDTALKSLAIPKQVSSLGKKTFYHCKALKKIELPQKIKSIPEAAFEGCKKIRKIKLPKSISTIKKRAFANCSSLRTINIPEKTSDIGEQAFARTAIKEVKLSPRIRTLKYRVFGACDDLEIVNISAGVRKIDFNAFWSCIGIKQFRVASKNKKYRSEAGILYNKSMTKLIMYPYRKKDRSFTTPKRVKRVCSCAFEGNPYLRHVTINSTSIGRYAFAGMYNLRSVTISPGAKRIERCAFSLNKKMTSIKLPDSIVSIQEEAFYNSGVRTLHIPAKLASFNKYAFYCKKLTAFTGSKTRGKYRVKDGILYNSSFTTLMKYPQGRKDKTFTTPKSVKSIYSWGIVDNPYLKKLYLGKKVTHLYSEAISGAFEKGLRLIVIRAKHMKAAIGSIESLGSKAVIKGPDVSILRKIAKNLEVKYVIL